ncbi:hypothetical protein N2W54_006321 [Lotmaria passim]
MTCKKRGKKVCFKLLSSPPVCVYFRFLNFGLIAFHSQECKQGNSLCDLALMKLGAHERYVCRVSKLSVDLSETAERKRGRENRLRSRVAPGAEPRSSFSALLSFSLLLHHHDSSKKTLTRVLLRR